MVFTRFSARSTTEDVIMCNDSSFLQCPQTLESIGWGMLLFGFLITVWKMGGFDKRRKKTTTGESNSKEAEKQLPSLPYPQPPSEIYEDASLKEHEPDTSTSIVADPFLVTDGFDNSPISRDNSFKQMTMPELALKWRKSVNHSTFDLPGPMVAQSSSKLQLDPIIKLHDHDDDDDDKKESTPYLRPASPPPAYVHSPHSKA